ncbi:MAG: hypothetical protein OEZ25_05710 [Candidatus Bathyarchaeota archaeon]|nr:hypothetical protein [Candidatus Bathyarchaeota archaeon]
MATPGVLTEEQLYRFLEEHGDSRVKRQLLVFWGRHPRAKFEENAICYTLNRNRSDIDRALRAQVKAGLVDTYMYKNVTLYSLTTNEERRRLVVGLTDIGWGRQQLKFRRIEKRGK